MTWSKALAAKMSLAELRTLRLGCMYAQGPTTGEDVMGTKNNPGEYDCYAIAEPDEPMFVLIARDRDASALVRQWARARQLRGEHPRKVAEAQRCADAMEAWRTDQHVACQHDHATSLMVGAPAPVGGAVSSVWSWCPDCGAIQSDGTDWTLPTRKQEKT